MSTHMPVVGADALADAAAACVRTNMRIALGTGRAAARCITAIAKRAQLEGLKLDCTATSEASERLAVSLGLTVRPLGECQGLDMIIDGADEVLADLSMLKGAGGAMTREKIAAEMVAAGTAEQPQRIYCIDHSKLVATLGARYKLPLEVLPMAHGRVLGVLAALGLGSVVREKEGARVLTDDRNLILDVALDWAVLGKHGLDAAGLARSLSAVTGIVGHGLFLNHADVVLVETPTGVHTMKRE